MSVEPGRGLLPFGNDVGLGRQGAEGRPLDLVEQVAAAGPELSGPPVIQPIEWDEDNDV